VGANEVLAVIEEEGMLANAREIGAYALGALRAIDSPLISEVRGVGLMLAVDLVSDFAARAAIPAGRPPSLWIADQFHAAGLLTVPSGALAFRWLPPLNVSRAEIDAVQITADLLRKLA
jgi:4-aminobutyrate aminotransferase-like enzyme